jgi:hypothetical protein
MSSGTLVLVLLARVTERRGHDFRPKLLASATPSEQAQQVRVWKSIEWDTLGSVHRKESGILPLDVAGSGVGDVVVLDAADYSLKRLRVPDLEVLSRTAIAPEAIRAVSVPVLGMTAWEDHVWISNPDGQVVRINLHSGAYRALPTSTYKIAHALDVLVLLLPPNRADVLATVQPNGHVIRGFGRFLEDQARVSIALDGAITVDRTRHRIFYSPAFGGFIASYDISGNRRFLVESIDPSPVPRLRKDGRGMYLIPQPRENRVMALAAFEDMLFALVHVPGIGSEQERVIDVYQGGTGAYLYSLRVPGRPSGLVIEGGVLVAANTEGITALDLSRAELQIGRGVGVGGHR